MKKYDVYALGNALVDTEYHLDDSKLEALGIEKGLMTLIDETRQAQLMRNLGDAHENQACGGSAANSVVVLSQLGGRAHLDCRVANDAAGSLFAQDLKRSGVDSNLEVQRAPTGVTGSCLVLVTPDAERSMNTCLGVSAELERSDIDQNAIAQSQYAYLEGYLATNGATCKLAEEVRCLAEGYQVKTALSLSDAGVVRYFRADICNLIGSGVDLLFANEAEANALVQSQSLHETLAALQQFSRSFVLTRGPLGALVFDGARILEIKPHAVKAIDTLGAGDLFAGAFLYGLSHAMDFQQAGDLASLISAQVVAQYGSRLEAALTATLLQQFISGNLAANT